MALVVSRSSVSSFGRRSRSVCENQRERPALVPKANRPVPEFLPFRGIRYALNEETSPADVGSVAAPPYDVIDDDSRAALESADPRNSVRLILPRHGADRRDRYQIAPDCFEEWHRTGALVLDDPARVYLYELLFEDENGLFRRTPGGVGALGL